MELYSLNEAFYTQQMMNPMSSGQIALWHALVRIANKAHWPDWFSTAGITLVQLSGLSLAGVKKARNELKQRGLIDFRANGTKATSYHLNDIQESSQDSIRNSSQNGSQDSSRNSSQNGSALRILNNTKQNTTPLPPPGDGGGIARYLEENLRGMTAWNYEELGTYLDDGVTPDLVRYAVGEAGAHGVRTWAYVRKVLNNCLNAGALTVEQAKDLRKDAPDEKPSNRFL